MNLGSSTTDSSKTLCLLQPGLCVVTASDVTKADLDFISSRFLLVETILGASSLIKNAKFTFKKWYTNEGFLRMRKVDNHYKYYPDKEHHICINYSDTFCLAPYMAHFVSPSLLGHCRTFSCDDMISGPLPLYACHAEYIQECSWMNGDNLTI